MMQRHEELPKKIDLALLVCRHFEKLRPATVPVSIRRQVDAIHRQPAAGSYTREELIREVERCAVERGLPVYFDARIRTKTPVSA
ncbi:MAG: hypothetical protein ACTHJ3_18510 [Pararhizobium sp.]